MSESQHMRLRKLLRSNSGFTLVEMLASIAVLALLTGLIAMGVSVGIKVYQQSTFVSESAVLEETIDNAMGDPFRYMQCTTTTTSGTTETTYRIVYRDDDKEGKIVSTAPLLDAYDPDTGQLGSGMLYLRDSTKDGGSANPGLKILNESAYTDCYVTDVQCTITPTEVTGSYIIRSRTNDSLSRTCDFAYVVLDATKAS